MSSRVERNIVRRVLWDVLVPPQKWSAGETRPRSRNAEQDSTKWSPPSNACVQARSEQQPLRISIVERLTESTLSVDWSDPCLGHYSDQIWRIGLARVNSNCVLTGVPIRRGDTIFRPRLGGMYRPANSHRMILASAASDYLRNQNP